MRMSVAQRKQKRAVDIGAKTVAKTLQSWTKKRVDLSTTTDTITLSESTDIIDAPKNYIVLYTEVASIRTPGVALMIMNKKDALALIDLLGNKKAGKTKTIDKIGKSALIETSNLLSGSYMNALSRLSNIALVSSIPEFVSIKKVKNIVRYIAKKSCKKTGKGVTCKRLRKGVIFVNEFIIKPYRIKIDLFLLFDRELLNILAKK